MTIEEINVQVANRDSLSEKEKKELVKAMLVHPKGKEILFAGAVSLENWDLAISLILNEI